MNLFRYMFGKWVYGYSVPMKVVRSLGLRQGGTLYLVGSGFGETAFMTVRKVGARVKGFEIHTSLVSLGKKRAEARGLRDKAFFHNISDLFEKDCGDCDAAMVESVLSFLEDPGGVVSRLVECLKPLGRLGVVELVWTSQPSENDVIRYKELLGVNTSPRTDDEWVEVLSRPGLGFVRKEVVGIGLYRKFWQDLAESPESTFSNLFKTIQNLLGSGESRAALRDFRLFYRFFSGRLAAGCYVFEKIAG
ncbi:MAG: methyltransferase domain-containing protein [Candidatus Caldarchaeum sp.]